MNTSYSAAALSGGPESRAEIERLVKGPNAYRTISEVADDLHVPQHVLRFWETRFPDVKPLKRGGGRRYYSPEDIAILRDITDLLYVQGYTIKGVQRVLKERAEAGTSSETAQISSPVPALPVASAMPAATETTEPNKADRASFEIPEFQASEPEYQHPEHHQPEGHDAAGHESTYHALTRDPSDHPAAHRHEPENEAPEGHMPERETSNSAASHLEAASHDGLTEVDHIPDPSESTAFAPAAPKEKGAEGKDAEEKNVEETESASLAAHETLPSIDTPEDKASSPAGINDSALESVSEPEIKPEPAQGHEADASESAEEEMSRDTAEQRGTNAAHEAVHEDVAFQYQENAAQLALLQDELSALRSEQARWKRERRALRLTLEDVLSELDNLRQMLPTA